MASARREYETTPDDLARMDRVHALITAHPEEFGDAAAWIDDLYSPDALHTRSEKKKEFLADIAANPAPPSKIDYSGLTRMLRQLEIPDRRDRLSRAGWDAPTRRWDVLLHNFDVGYLPIQLPNPPWDQVAPVLLVYWITCDERAENGPPLTKFQTWRWSDTEDALERSVARCWVADWSKLNRGVDLALAVAERKGLHATPTAIASSPGATAVVPRSGNREQHDARTLTEEELGGFASPSDLAGRFGVNAENLRKRLGRWRLKHEADCIDDPSRKSRQPRYLYRLGAVLPVIQSMKASGETSGERPAKRDGRT
jgi:hypothetical protein